MYNLSNLDFVEAQVFYLKMKEKPITNVSTLEDVSFLQLSHPISVKEYQLHYAAVGFEYHWLDRLVMPEAELNEKINAENAIQFLFQHNKQNAGFVEFIIEKDFVEILYFGLYPAFVGKGFGKYFLRWAIQQAWSYSPKWIQLNTCSLDHPTALSVYKNAGFEETHRTAETRRILVK